jgi:hypothetical protein
MDAERVRLVWATPASPGDDAQRLSGVAPPRLTRASPEVWPARRLRRRSSLLRVHQVGSRFGPRRRRFERRLQSIPRAARHRKGTIRVGRGGSDYVGAAAIRRPSRMSVAGLSGPQGEEAARPAAVSSGSIGSSRTGLQLCRVRTPEPSRHARRMARMKFAQTGTVWRHRCLRKVRRNDRRRPSRRCFGAATVTPKRRRQRMPPWPVQLGIQGERGRGLRHSCSGIVATSPTGGQRARTRSRPHEPSESSSRLTEPQTCGPGSTIGTGACWTEPAIVPRGTGIGDGSVEEAPQGRTPGLSGLAGCTGG